MTELKSPEKEEQVQIVIHGAKEIKDSVYNITFNKLLSFHHPEIHIHKDANDLIVFSTAKFSKCFDDFAVEIAAKRIIFDYDKRMVFVHGIGINETEADAENRRKLSNDERDAEYMTRHAAYRALQVSILESLIESEINHIPNLIDLIEYGSHHASIDTGMMCVNFLVMESMLFVTDITIKD